MCWASALGRSGLTNAHRARCARARSLARSGAVRPGFWPVTRAAAASSALGWSSSCAAGRTGPWATADPDSPARRSTEPDRRAYLRQVSAEVSDGLGASTRVHDTDCMFIKHIRPPTTRRMRMLVGVLQCLEMFL